MLRARGRQRGVRRRPGDRRVVRHAAEISVAPLLDAGILRRTFRRHTHRHDFVERSYRVACADFARTHLAAREILLIQQPVLVTDELVTRGFSSVLSLRLPMP